jgi:hypothetical protein
MTNFLSAEFIGHLERRTLKSVLSAGFGVRFSRLKNFQQCGNTTLQKNHSPFATRHSLFTIHQSPFAVVSARHKPRSPILSTD